MSVPVEGTCTAGHVTREVAPKGRVTWSGTCSADGCNRRVTARRLPRTTTPDAAAAPSPDAPYIRLDSYAGLPDHDPSAGLHVEPGGDVQGAGDGAGAAAAQHAGGGDLEHAEPDPVSGGEPGEPAAAGARSHRQRPRHPIYG